MWIKDCIQKYKERKIKEKEKEKFIRFVKAVVALAWDYWTLIRTNSKFYKFKDWDRDGVLKFAHESIYTNYWTQLYGLKYWEKNYNRLVKEEKIPDDWKIERIIEYLRNKSNGNGDDNELNS